MFLIPENEQGTIVTFVQMEKLHGFKIVSIGIEYPDAIVERDGVEYRAEFEFLASNFIAHQHDIRKCDIVICWESDINKSEFPLPILELSDQSSISNVLFVPNETKVELFYWKNKAKSADRIISGMRGKIDELQRRSNESLIDDSVLTTLDKRVADRRKKVLLAYQSNPEMSIRECAESIGASKTTVSSDLEWLLNSGIVHVSKAGKSQTVILNGGSAEFLAN